MASEWDQGLRMKGHATTGADAPIEGFAVETHDGSIFTVKGLVHPADAVVAYLRYAPDPSGPRARAGVRYRRLYGFEEIEAALRVRAPHYLRHDPLLGVLVQAVPTQDIRSIHDPRRLLLTLSTSPSLDPLQEAAVALARLLESESGAAAESMGVTGSLLVGLHEPSSDIDVVVYGERESRAVHEALESLFSGGGSPVRPANRAELARIHEGHRADTPLTGADFVRLQERKVNEGRFAGRPFFVRFVKRPTEVDEAYGDPRYEPLGPALVRARVYDHQEAMFTLCRYLIEDTTVDGGPMPMDVVQIVSFRGRFADQARAGERIVARGAMERVIPRSGAGLCRLVVGAQPGDYFVSEP